MMEIDVLPKTCHCWYVDKETLPDPQWRPFLQQVTRITKSIGIPHNFSNDQALMAADIARPEGATLALSMFPFSFLRSGTNEWTNAGSEYEYIHNTCERFLGLGIPIGSVLLDPEKFNVVGDLRTSKLGLAFDIVREAFPNASILWYRNGDWAPMLDVPNDGIRTVACYRIDDPSYTEQVLAHAQQKRDADAWGVWVTMGSGYRNGEWRWDAGLDAKDYWWWGRMLAEWPEVQHLLFYPHPTRPVCTTGVPSFIAFAKGLLGKALDSHS